MAPSPGWAWLFALVRTGDPAAGRLLGQLLRKVSGSRPVFPGTVSGRQQAPAGAVSMTLTSVARTVPVPAAAQPASAGLSPASASGRGRPELSCSHCGGSGMLRLGDQRYRTCLDCLGSGQPLLASRTAMRRPSQLSAATSSACAG